MKTLFVIFLLSVVSLAAEAERCAQPGAVRCDDGRHLSVCLEGSATWLRVRDCAASGLVCAGARCASSNSSIASNVPSARAENCVYGTDIYRCSSDCTDLQVCITANVWFTFVVCDDGQLCDENSFTCKPTAQAMCSNNFEGIYCPSFEGRFPDLSNASRFYVCQDGNLIGERMECPEQEGDKDYFNACSGKCDYRHNPINRYPNKCTISNNGYSNYIFSNPALYYICSDGIPMWKKCDIGYYENEIGECIGETDYSELCEMSNIPSPTYSTFFPTDVPTDETSFLTDETTFLTDENTFPTDDTTFPSDETTFPTDETTFPTDETTFPTDETTFPTDETTVSTDETIFPTDETTFPTDETTFPTDETTFPTEETTIPSDVTTFPTDVTTDTVTLDPSKCSDPGVSIPDSEDPCWYFFCSADGLLQHRKCANNFIFDVNYGRCAPSLGSCYTTSS